MSSYKVAKLFELFGARLRRAADFSLWGPILEHTWKRRRKIIVRLDISEIKTELIQL